jgi:hypothetical protein
MKRWEYKRFVLAGDKSRINPDYQTIYLPGDKREAWLNEMGEEGWELVTYLYSGKLTEPLVIFKRPMQSLADSAWIANGQ